MSELKKLLDNNKIWSDQQLRADPDFFNRLLDQQSPSYLWIGCSDSRVPANQILGLAPGEVFVHRNVANLVINTDFNCLSVLQYAVEVLKIKHVIICGHYGCGGVRAACGHAQFGLIDNWLRNIKIIYAAHKQELEKIKDESRRVDRLCELNVYQQVLNVCQTTIIQNRWAAGGSLSVHGLIYNLKDGLLKDLATRINSNSQLDSIYRVSPLEMP